MKSIYLNLACLALFTAFSQGASLVTVNISTDNRVLRDAAGAALTGGSTADGNGAVVQVGYYTNATVGNNFGNALSTFVPLTGEGSLFNVVTTIGDANANGAGSGTLFSNALNIFAGLNGGANDGLFPTVGTPLSIRFFNATTIAASTFSESISNNLWLWKAPAAAPTQPILNLFLDDAGLVAKNPLNVNAGTAGTSLRTFTPTASAPEPASSALLMVGLVSLAVRRRRQTN